MLTLNRPSNTNYDITPGEVRGRMIRAYSGHNADGTHIYERIYVDQNPNQRFYEPLDLSDQISETHFQQHGPANGSGANSTTGDHQKERERLKTFDGVWKDEYHVHKEDLAREGFIYKGPADRVMCVFCQKTIWKWESGDTVVGEHKRLYPRCPWVRGEADHLNIPLSKTDNMKRNMRVATKGQPRFSDMSSTADRIKTFNKWTKRNDVTVNNLANAGFFYDADNDIVTCFHCATKIPGWKVDKDVRTYHTQISPDCYLTQQADSLNPNTSSRAAVDVQLDQENGLNGENRGAQQRRPEEITNIDEDMRSPAAQAVILLGDYSMEEIRKAVLSLRISKGSDYDINSADILESLDAFQ